MIRRFLKKFRVGIYALMAVILVSVSGDLVADGLGKAFPTESAAAGWKWIVVGLVALAFGYLLAWRAVRHVQRQPYDFDKAVEPPPIRPVVVLGLSTTAWGVDLNTAKGAHDPGRIVLRQGSDAYQLGQARGLRGFLDGCAQTNLADGAGTIADKFSWCVPLTAIDHHLDKLKVVGIVTSTGSPPTGATHRQGSHEQANDFVALLTLLLKDDRRFDIKRVCVSSGEGEPDGTASTGALGGGRRQVVIATFEYPVDFDEVTPVYERVDHLIHRFGNEELRGADVVVDATGGTTPAGIAAALASLNSDVWLQYVNKDRKVTGFNYNIRQSPVLPT